MEKTASRRCGFTLIEILVTLTICAILGLVLFASMQSIMKSARSAACQQNLKTIGIGMQMYASDNAGFFPPHWGESGAVTLAWYGFVAPYIINSTFDPNAPMDSRFFCPDGSNAKPGFQTYISTLANNQGQSYGYNYYRLTQNYGGQGVFRQQSVKSLSKLVLVVDIPQIGSLQPSQKLPMQEYLLYPGAAALGMRHPGNSCNAVFADGHVENINAQAFATPGLSYDVGNWDPGQ